MYKFHVSFRNHELWGQCLQAIAGKVPISDKGKSGISQHTGTLAANISQRCFNAIFDEIDTLDKVKLQRYIILLLSAQT